MKTPRASLLKCFCIAALLAYAASVMTPTEAHAAEKKKTSASSKHSKKPASTKKTTSKKSTSKKSSSQKSAAKAAPAPESPSQQAINFAQKKQWPEAKAAAARSGKPALEKLVEWMRLQDADSRATFQEITRFIRANAHWPQQQRLQLRAEQSIRFSYVSDAALAEWFAEKPPTSGAGKIRLAEVNMARGAQLASPEIRALIQDGWVSGDFDADEESRITTVYRDILTPDDHAKRTDRLLWEEKTTLADRMLPLLSDDQRALAHARIALLDGTKDASFQLSHVPRALMQDAGLIYARAVWRQKNSDDAGVKELLLSAPATVPFPEKWWRLREPFIRRAVDAQDYALAGRLLANHGQVDGADLAEATWLSGWLNLQFLNNPKVAYDAFYTMYNGVKFPVSRARAAYWAGRAAEKAVDSTAAEGWFQNAAQHTTTFYGQVAFAKLNPGKPLPLPAEGKGTSSIANDVIDAIRIAAEAREYDIATALSNHLMDSVPEGQVAPLARQIAALERGPLAVRAAKRAQQRGIPLIHTGYPLLKPEVNLAVELPLALAITRQESEFDRTARSRANAIGMMQLLPATAREQAKKMGLPFSENRLTEVTYNMQLGSGYLNRMINAYDGSMVLAFAAYNAGPGNVRGFMREFGSPGGTVENTLDWIEKIPFSETRNYVMRVMENLHVYRTLENPSTPLSIEQDLMR